MIRQSPRNPQVNAVNTRLTTVIQAAIRTAFQEAVSSLPAKVLKVNYERCTVDVEVSVRNDWGINKKNKYANLFDIPLFINSGNNNKARQTFPIQAGDLVEVAFCDKDPTNFILGDGKTVQDLESYAPFSMGSYLYGLVAYPCIQIPATMRPLDPVNVVTENEKAIQKLSPDGTYNFTDGNGSDFTISSGSLTGTFPNGAKINNAQITPDGDVITSDGISLREFYAEFKAHVHGGVKAGSDKTSPPTT